MENILRLCHQKKIKFSLKLTDKGDLFICIDNHPEMYLSNDCSDFCDKLNMLGESLEEDIKIS